MSWFSQRSAVGRSRRWWWMLALYAAFVTSVGLSADRQALLGQVQAMTETPRASAPVRSTPPPAAETAPPLRRVSAR